MKQIEVGPLVTVEKRPKVVEATGEPWVLL